MEDATKALFQPKILNPKSILNYFYFVSWRKRYTSWSKRTVNVWPMSDGHRCKPSLKSSFTFRKYYPKHLHLDPGHAGGNAGRGHWVLQKVFSLLVAETWLKDVISRQEFNLIFPFLTNTWCRQTIVYWLMVSIALLNHIYNHIVCMA